MASFVSYLVNIDKTQYAIESGQTILDAALEADIDFPYSCQVGSCSTCRCQLVSGDIRELTDFAYVLEEEALEQGIILACQSVAKSDLVLRFVK
jgi:ferredoxin